MLRKFVAIFCLLLIVAALCICVVLQPPSPMELPPRGAHIQGAVLIVPGAGRSGPVDVIVEGSRIAQITPSTQTHIESYILPGLSDAHMHEPIVPLPGHQQLFAFLYLYHGVTLVRMAAGDTEMRDAIARGDYPGPQVVSCSPFVDGDPPFWRNSLVVPRDLSAREAIDSIREGGFDCVKVYNELTADASQNIYAQASAAGLPVIGHVPWRQDFEDARIDDLQHLVGWAESATDDAEVPQVLRLRKLSEMSDSRIDDLVRAALDREFQLTPTLITLQRKAAFGEQQFQAQLRGAELLPDFYAAQLWHPDSGLVSSRLMDAEDHQRYRRALPIAFEAVRRMHAAGVEIHAGTDSPAEAIVPGAGLIEELELLHRAGLSAEQVLQISAVNTPKRLRSENSPPLAVGAHADFVVYEQDPTRDLVHLDSRTAVVADGRYFDAAALDTQLERYRNWFDSRGYRWITDTAARLALGLLNALSPGREPLDEH